MGAPTGLRARPRTGRTHIKVAVNLSPVQFKSRNLVAVGGQRAGGTPACAANRLQLEITETVLMHNNDATLATLHQLRELGVQIAMDDFGTGYSSLSYLRSFPFDKIKIDRSFIQDLVERRRAARHRARRRAASASSLNMISTAEGVETQQQLDQLQSVGCTEMQGYLFSHARPAADIVRLFLQPVEQPAPAGVNRTPQSLVRLFPRTMTAESAIPTVIFSPAVMPAKAGHPVIRKHGI